MDLEIIILSEASQTEKDKYHIIFFTCIIWASLVAQRLKHLPANVRDVRDAVLIPGWETSPGEGHDNPLQFSCLENPMDRGA